MPIVFACECRLVIIAPDAAAGQPARCPRCGRRVRVPSASNRRAAALAAASDETVRVPAGLTLAAKPVESPGRPAPPAGPPPAAPARPSATGFPGRLLKRRWP